MEELELLWSTALVINLYFWHCIGRWAGKEKNAQTKSQFVTTGCEYEWGPTKPELSLLTKQINLLSGFGFFYILNFLVEGSKLGNPDKERAIEEHYWNRVPHHTLCITVEGTSMVYSGVVWSCAFQIFLFRTADFLQGCTFTGCSIIWGQGVSVRTPCVQSALLNLLEKKQNKATLVWPYVLCSLSWNKHIWPLSQSVFIKDAVWHSLLEGRCHAFNVSLTWVWGLQSCGPCPGPFCILSGQWSCPGVPQGAVLPEEWLRASCQSPSISPSS